MKKFFKIFAALLAFLTMTALYSGNTAMAKRTDNPKTTTLHIIKLASSSTPKAIDHDGTKIGNLSDLTQRLGTEVKPLGGVKFTYFKVNDQATLDKLLAKPADYTTVDQVKTILGASATGTETAATDASSGEVSLTLEDGLYWFIETAKPETVSSAVAVPFGISLPMTNKEGTAEMDEVYIYPKNVDSTLPVPEKTVGDLTGKADSYDINKEFKWFLQTNIPTNIKDYTKFEFQDTLDEKLDYVGRVKVTYGDEEVPAENYEIQEPSDANKRQFKLTFKTNDESKLTYFAGLEQSVIDTKKDKKLVVEFTSKINKNAVMGEVIKNNFDLVFKNNPSLKDDQKKTPENPPTVVTGGKKFKKIDATTNKTALKDAEFIIQNTVGTGESAKTTYLHVDEATGAVTWGEKEQATTFKSGEDGTFEVKGLAFTQAKQAGQDVVNKYELVETKAPTGYALLVEPIEFTIDDKSYGDAEGVLKEVVNKKLTIPQTGGIGTILFAVVGVTLMAGAVIFMKRREA